MNEDQVRQQLWEFIYELLPEDQMQEWRERITSDPDIARLYAEVKLLADQVAEALVYVGPTVPLSVPESVSHSVDTADQTVAIGPGHGAAVTRKARSYRPWLNLATVAATLLLAMGWFGVSWMDRHDGQLATGGRSAVGDAVQLRMVVPPHAVPGLDVPIAVEARYSSSGETADVPLELRLTKGEGIAWRTPIRSGAKGATLVRVPAERVGPEARVSLVAPQGQLELISAQLPASRRLYVTHLATDRLFYNPGQTVRFRSVTLNPITMEPANGGTVEFRIEHVASGTTFTVQPSEASISEGVAHGLWRVPSEDRDVLMGEYRVVVSSREQLFADVERPFVVRPESSQSWALDAELTRRAYRAGDVARLDLALYGALPGNLPVDLTITQWLGSQNQSLVQRLTGRRAQVAFRLPETWLETEPLVVEVEGRCANEQFQRVSIAQHRDARPRLRMVPEGGTLVAGLPGRLYFEARDPIGIPIAFDGFLVDQDGRRVLSVQTDPALPGFGMVAWTPESGNEYWLESGNGRARWPVPPAIHRPDALVLRVDQSVLPPSSPIRVKLYAAQAGRSYAVLLRRSGLVVAQRVIITQPGRPSEPIEVPMELPEEVAGVVRVEVYNLQSRPKLTASRLVFRRPGREWIIRRGEMQQPTRGSMVEEHLTVLDEQGHPAQALAGVNLQEQSATSTLAASLVADVFFTELRRSFADTSLLVDLLQQAREDDFSRKLDLLLVLNDLASVPPIDTDSRQLATSGVLAAAHEASHSIEGDISHLAAEDVPAVIDSLTAFETQVRPSQETARLPAWPRRFPAPPWWLVGASLGLVLLVTILALVRLVSVWVWTASFGAIFFAVFAAFVLMSVPHRRAVFPVAAYSKAGAEPANSSETANGLASKTAVDEQAQVPQSAPESEAVSPPSPATPAVAVDPLGEAKPHPTSGIQGLPAFQAEVDKAQLQRSPDPAAVDQGRRATNRAAVPSAGKEQVDVLASAPVGGPGFSEWLLRRGYTPGDYQVEIGPQVRNHNAGRLESDRFSQNAVLSDLRQARRAASLADSILEGKQDAGRPQSSETVVESGLWDAERPITNGVLAFSWPVPRSPESYRAWVAVHGNNRIGELQWDFTPIEPVGIESADLREPMILCAGDRLEAALQISNRSSGGVEEVSFSSDNPNVRVAFSPAEADRPSSSNLSGKLTIKVEAPLSTTPVAVDGSLEDLLGWWRYEPGSLPIRLRWATAPHAASGAYIGYVVPRGIPRFEQHVELRSTQASLIGGEVSQATWRCYLVRLYPSLAAEVLDTARWLSHQETPPLARWLAAELLNWCDRFQVSAPADKRIWKRWLATVPSARGLAPIEAQWLTVEEEWVDKQVVNDTAVQGILEVPADSHPLALVIQARVAALTKHASAEQLLTKLREMQISDGAVLPSNRDASASVTLVENTSLAILAWSSGLSREHYQNERQRALDWLRHQRRWDGGYGSPHATSLALLALLTTDDEVPSELGPPQVVDVWMEETQIDSIMFADDSVEPYVRLYVGRPERPVALRVLGRSPYQPFSSVLAVGHWSDALPSQEGPYRLEVDIQPQRARRGAEGSLKVRLSGAAPSAALVRLSMPAGVELQGTQLPPDAQFHGRNLWLRFESPFDPPQEWVKSPDLIEFSLPVRFRSVGEFTGAASYVVPERDWTAQSWAPPLRVTVDP